MGQKKDWALTRHMERAGLDLAALAGQSEVSLATLKRWKKGARPSAKLQDQVYEALAEALRDRHPSSYGSRPLEDVVREIRETCEGQPALPDPVLAPHEDRLDPALQSVVAGHRPDPLAARLIPRFPDTREAVGELVRLLHALLEVWAKQHGAQYRREGDVEFFGHGAIRERRAVGGLQGPIHFFLGKYPDSIRAPPNGEILISVMLDDRLDRDGRSDRDGSWGPSRIVELLRACPSLFARYFPDEARGLLPGYDGVSFAELAAEYRRKMADHSRHIQFIGFPPEVRKAKDARPDIPLARIFVPPVLAAWSAKHPAHPVADLLRENASTVILGDPGMGKTTLLTYLALLFAEEGHAFGDYTSERPRLPFVVPIRDFERLRGDKEKHQKEPFTLLDYLDHRAKSDLQIQRSHWAFFDAAMRMGDAVLLVDGLDEAGSEAARARLRDIVQGLREEYPACPIWVTSRIHGYTADVRLDANRFSHGRLERLTDAQIDGFIGRWYEIQIPENPRECAEATESLRQAVRESRGVQLLAGNPLLLTLMAFVHRAVGTLPKDRGELYEQCVTMLLKTWLEARRRGGVTERHPFEATNLSVARQKDYLAHLALRAQERATREGDDESRALIPRKEALACLAQWHHRHSRRDRPGLTSAEAVDEMKHFLDYACDAVGLLVDKGGGQVAFLHLSFQEYLAAFAPECPANELTTAVLFEKKLGEQAWEEVVLLRAYVVLKKENEEENAALDGILDGLVARWQDLGESGRLTLVKLLRDDLRVAPRHGEALLDLAVRGFSHEASFTGVWFQVLDQVARYGEGWRVAFRERLRVLQDGPVDVALSALHLQAKLFGVPEESASRWARRWEEASVDLCGFWDDGTLGPVVLARARAAEWRGVWAALDAAAAYDLALAATCTPSRLSAAALYGVAAWMGGVIVADLASRTRLATPEYGSDHPFLFAGGGTIWRDTTLYSIAALAGALRVPGHGRRLELGAGQPCGARVEALLRAKFAEPPSSAEIEAPWLRAVTSRIAEELALFVEPADDRRPFDRAKGKALSRTFVHGFVRRFNRGCDDDFVRSFEVVRGFVHELGPNFGRVFGGEPDPPDDPEEDFSSIRHDFVLRTVDPDFVHNFAVAFGREFGGAFGRGLVGDFGPDFHSSLTNRKSAEGLLEKEEFWEPMVDEIWSESDSDDDSGTEIRAQIQPGATLRNPFAMPLFLPELWLVPFANHVIAAARHAAVSGDFDTPSNAFSVWLSDHPASVYTASFAWEHQARAYQAQHHRLEGAHGVVFVMHAAYAALFSSQPCAGPTWDELLAERNRSDPAIELACLLNEVCHFRGGEETLDKLLSMLRDPPPACKDLVEAMALAMDPSKGLTSS